MEQNRMTRLMISRNLLLLVRDHTASLLCTDTYLDKGLLDILRADTTAPCLGCGNGSLVHQVLQICSGKACGGLSDLL